MHDSIIIPFNMMLLLFTLIVGVFNLFYSLRIKKAKKQLGLELPAISLTLLKLGTFFAVFSIGLMVFFIFTVR